MDISVQDITAVDKEIKIQATREDLEPKFESALKKYRGQIQMPGFRKGKVPLSIVRKRFGEEIEMEEINNYVQEVFEKQIVEDHEPVGESQITDFQWENDQLEVTFKIGVKPEFELTDLKKITVDKMVHDVTDEEAGEEIERILERNGNREEVDGPISADNIVTVDAMSLDKEGNTIEGEVDEDQTLNLKDEGAKDFRDALAGKKAGEIVDMELGEGDEKDRFRLVIKKVEKSVKAELTDEFAKNQSNGEANNVEELRSYIKSRMQQYYDQTADDMIRQELMSEMANAHDFKVPDQFRELILNRYLEQAKRQSGNQLPPDFDEQAYKERLQESAIQEAKWHFINLKLQEKYDDIEITPEDIDAFLATEAAKMGATIDQIKQWYAQNPQQFEALRTNIRENKVFEKLKDAVNINELSKEDVRKKREKESGK